MIRIEIVEVFDCVEGALRLFHLSDVVGANQSFEWWISKDGKHHALYSQDAFYDESLRQRRNAGNMICPQDKMQRLVHVGQVSRQIDLLPTTFVELFRGDILLESACVDEK